MGGPAGPVGIFWVRGFTDVTPRPSNAPPPPPDPPRGVAAKELWRKVPGERTSMGKGKEKEKGGGGGGGVTHVSWGLVCAGVIGRNNTCVGVRAGCAKHRDKVEVPEASSPCHPRTCARS